MASRCATKLIVIWMIVLVHTVTVNTSCRETKLPRDCEALCSHNQHGFVSCELRAAVLLPVDTKFDISLPRVLPVLELAAKEAKARKLLPSWLELKFLPKDDRCDATYAQIAAIDSYADCVHLFLGPACEYCVANVGRVAKFLGAPLITTGGFTYDFTEKKTECSDEYFMTTRIGSLSFRDISNFFLSIMDQYQWRKVHLIYAPNGQTNFAGRHTCQLMMKSMAQLIKKRENINFGNFDVEALTLEEYPESLKTDVGNYYGGMKLSGIEATT